MVIDFSNNDLRERPILVLKNINGLEIQTLGYAFNISAEIHFNETSKLSFDLPAYVNGEKTPHYDEVVGMRYIDLVGYGQFVLEDPETENDGLKEIKHCSAYSIEYELTFKQISLTESTYNFYNPLDLNDTIMGIILEYCPSWSIGTVSTNLLNKYRTFEIDGDNIYNFIKSTLQPKYRCIFDFDTYARKINVISVEDFIGTQPVFLSLQNVLKNVEVSEDSENVFTCLDVFGADGVNIIPVNPMGNNKIYDLDYLIESGHLSDAFIEKWRAWENNFNSQQDAFYQLVVEQAIYTTGASAQSAAKLKLDGEMTGLEAKEATYVSAIAQGLEQDDEGHYFTDLLEQVKVDIAAKKNEISSVDSQIKDAEQLAKDAQNQMNEIVNSCKFENFFSDYVCPYCGGVAHKTEEQNGLFVCQECGNESEYAESELLVLDRCFKETTLEDTSFVAETVTSYKPTTANGTMSQLAVSISNAVITKSTDAAGSKSLYNISGGKALIGGSIGLSANIVNAAVIDKSGSFILTANLNTGIIGDEAYTSGSLTISGTVSSISSDLQPDSDVGGDSYMTGTWITLNTQTAQLYFTSDVSEYASTAIAWDLYKYARETIKKLAYPSYTFSIDSGNFMAMDEFELFRKQIKLGKKIYLDLSLGNGAVLEPVCIGIKFNFDDLTQLTLEFSDTYSGLDYALSLVDLMEESVSAGKTVARKSGGWGAFVDSGASSTVKDFMDSALDVAKNKVLSSTGQSITWDESGLRLRKWADDDHTIYAPEQIWMTDRNIVFTDNGWETAKMALGMLETEEYGTVYGLVADYIVGRLLAGENMFISNKNGNFKIDENGIVINGLNFLISSGNIGEQGVETQSIVDYVDEHSLSSLTIHDGDNIFLDATKISGAINTQMVRMSACQGYMLYDQHGMWLMNAVSPQIASRAVWMNNEGILLGNERSSSEETDPSFNPDTNKSITWNTAISADGIMADYLIGEHMHATFDISAGAPTGVDYNTCPFYVSKEGELSATGAKINGTLDAERMLLQGKDVTSIFRAKTDDGGNANGLDLGSIGIQDGVIAFYNNNEHQREMGTLTTKPASSSDYAFEINSSRGAMRLKVGLGSLFMGGGGNNAWIELTDAGGIKMYSANNTLTLNGEPISGGGGGTAVFG